MAQYAIRGLGMATGSSVYQVTKCCLHGEMHKNWALSTVGTSSPAHWFGLWRHRWGTYCFFLITGTDLL